MSGNGIFTIVRRLIDSPSWDEMHATIDRAMDRLTEDIKELGKKVDGLNNHGQEIKETRDAIHQLHEKLDGIDQKLDDM